MRINFAIRWSIFRLRGLLGPIGLVLFCGCASSTVVPHRIHYEGGAIKERGNFKDGQRHGEWTKYGKDSTIVAQGTYRNGKEWIGSFIALETLAGRGEFEFKRSYKRGIKHGSYTAYYRDGNVMASGNYDKGARSGHYVDYYANGHTQQKGSYLDNKKNGMWTFFLKNGIKHIEAHYEHGKLGGKVTSYAQSGRQKYVGSYKDNERSGNWIWFYKDGSKRIEGQYATGIRSGQWLRYTLAGDTVAVANWGNNKSILVEAGIEEEYEYYLDSEKQRIKHGLYMKYYLSGEPRVFGAYRDGEKEGRWEGYWKHGQQAFEGTYQAGERTGIWIQRYPNGNVRSRKKFN